MEAWARSGAMDLTGRPDGPALGPPEGLVPYLDTVARMIAAASEQVGDAVSIDPLQLLGERAAISGFTRRGPVSCGGGTRLLQAYDDWVGVSLTRGDDWDLVSAWLEVDLEVDGWDALAAIVADRTAAELVLRAGWLGLPVARLGNADRRAADRLSVPDGSPVIRRRFRSATSWLRTSLPCGPDRWWATCSPTPGRTS